MIKPSASRVASRYAGRSVPPFKVRDAAAKTPSDLPDGWYVVARWVGPSRSFQLYDGKKEVGYIRATPNSSCGGAYTVRQVWAPSGWGPMLYDLMMEDAGRYGVMPDRSQVSEDSARVWFHYLTKRRRDVTAHPLWDDPSIRDDRACGYHYEDTGPGVFESLDYRYVKDGRGVTGSLEREGRLFEGEHPEWSGVRKEAVAQRYAKRPFDLAMNGLKGLDEGRTVTLYHGTTRSFDRFDLTKSRDELVNDFYGKGIFLTPSKNVAWKYANANRNIGLDPSIIGELKRKKPQAGAFLESLYSQGSDAWEPMLAEAKAAGHEPYEHEDFLNGVDGNTLGDIAGYIEGSAVPPRGGGSTNIFSTSSGAPYWLYDTLDEVGLDSSAYRPKVYTVGVTVQNPLITASASEARKARANGYDSVVFHGSRLVDGWPEVAVFSPRNAKIKKVEVE